MTLEDNASSEIGRLNPDGTYTVFPVSATSAVGLNGLATGADGALWFTETNTNLLGRMTTTGAITTFNVPTPQSGLGRIIAGPSRTLWFIEAKANKIGRYQL